jgi:polyphosphate glucokinase
MANNKLIQTLAVDIGGSGIKVMVLDEEGNPLTERDRVETPQPAKPDAVIAAIVGWLRARNTIASPWVFLVLSKLV